MGGPAIPILLGLAMGTQVIGAERGRAERTRTRRHAQERWQATAYPTAAEKQTARGQLGQAKLGAYQTLASELATRGFGPGSGYAAGRAGGLEGAYGRARAGMEAEMLKPRWRPPTGMEYAGPGGFEAGADWINRLAGFYWLAEMLGGGGRPVASPWGTAGGMVYPYGPY